MQAGILGLRQAQGKSKATGNPYDGWFLYYGSTNDETVVGMKTADTFVGADSLAPLLAKVGNDPVKLINKKVLLDFNDRGRLEGIDLLPNG
ncbi:MAG: hypothetical protein RSD27_01760 [Ruthenibacterium sp.]